MAGRLRSDLEFCQLNVGEDGLWIYRIYDPVAEKFYKVNQKAFEIIKYFSTAKTVPDLEDTLSQQGIPGNKDEIFSVITFLKSNKLIFSEVGHQTKKSISSRLIKSYLYFKIPLSKPDSFLTDTKFISHIFFNRITVFLLTLISLIGFTLLATAWENFYSGVKTGLSLSSLKIYIPVIFLVKFLHEMAHAYVAKLYGCKVRTLGLAFIFLTPRFYTDVSDLITIDKAKRINVALAGMWVEFILAGLACFVYIAAPLYSLSSELSIAIITVSLVSSFFFNGNPFMRFDGYYVLKEVLKEDNLYSNSTLAVKYFWRKAILNLKPEGRLNTKLLVYGHLSILYRIFLYTSIVVLVYHFFIPAVGILLALVEIWVFLVKPIVNEMKNIILRRKAIPVLNKLFALFILCGFIWIFFIKVSLPCSAPAFYGQNLNKIRAEIDGTIKSINDGYITIDNQDISHSINMLKNDLEFIRHRKRQMLAESKYSLLEVLNNMEERVNITLQQEEKKSQKLKIPIPSNVKFFNDENLINKFVEPGSEIAYSLEEPKLFAFFESYETDLPNKGKIFLKKSLMSRECKLNLDTTKIVEFVPEQLSSLHGGPILTDQNYRPLKPLKSVECITKSKNKYIQSCYLSYSYETTLKDEIIHVVKGFLHEEFF